VLFLYRMPANTAGKSIGRVRYSWIGTKCDVGVYTFIYTVSDISAEITCLWYCHQTTCLSRDGL
jgi:hypothetical protein